MLPMCYPADVDGGGFIPNWAMWFILELKDTFASCKHSFASYAAELIYKAEHNNN